MERIVVDQEQLTIPGHLSRQQSSSQLSDLAEYVILSHIADRMTHRLLCPDVLCAIQTLQTSVTHLSKKFMSKIA